MAEHHVAPPAQQFATLRSGPNCVEIIPATGPISGTCRVPGSKSLTNRALLLAGFAHGPSHLSGLLGSEDAHWARDVLKRLGMTTRPDVDDPAALSISGCGGSPPTSSGTLYLGDAGTLARFLPGFLAAARSGTWRLTGSAQLQKRPLAPLVDALEQMGGRLISSATGGLPVQVSAGGLEGGQVVLAGDVSSPFVSGVLMAAAASGRSYAVQVPGRLVQPGYVTMTARCLSTFGARIESLEPDDSARQWRVLPARLVGQRLCIEADVSTACYFWGLAAATGGRVTVANVGSDSTQADGQFLQVLERMGCRVDQDHGATTVIGPQILRGHFAVDMSHISDQAPTLAALAALADGPVQIEGVAHIRHHESDRLEAMSRALRAIGAQARPTATGLEVTPQPRHGGRIDTHQDHRIAMSMALVAARTPGVHIQDAQCVAKTCPQYFAMLEQLGLAVVGHAVPHA